MHPTQPDVVASTGGKRLFIEVAVTYDVDRGKLQHIKKIGASAILLDLRSHSRLSIAPSRTKVLDVVVKFLNLKNDPALSLDVHLAVVSKIGMEAH